jgi:hypothetical protein
MKKNQIFSEIISNDLDIQNESSNRISIADVVIQSNVIYTVASEETFSGGIAIKGNKIIAVDLMKNLNQYVTPKTTIMNMGDQTVMPGFIDGHTHTRVNHTVVGVNLIGVDSQEKAAEMIKQYINDYPDKTFVIGGGWSSNIGGNSYPHKRYIDAVVSDIPVVMKDLDGHAMWCNSKALELAGIDKSYADEFNQEHGDDLITVDSNGNPIGYLRESGCEKVKLIWPVYKTQDLEKCINVWLTYGVTAVNDMNPDQPGCDIHNQLKELNDSGKLLVRQFLSIVPETPESEIEETQKCFNSDMLHLNALKIFMDGTGSSFTASMLKPYRNLSHAGPEPYCSAEQIKSYIMKANKYGLAVHIHACGDRAVKTALDSYSLAKELGVSLDYRFSIEHMDTFDYIDMFRPAMLGISCNVTPDFLAPTAQWCDNPYLKIYDKAVLAKLWRYASLYRTGANISFGTDTYSSSYNPMVQIYRALERVADDGEPTGGYEPEEKFTIKEAIRCYTLNGAKSIGMEKKLGTLEAGKYADIIVLDHNILDCSDQELRNTKVVLTMLGGKVVYQKT